MANLATDMVSPDPTMKDNPNGRISPESWSTFDSGLKKHRITTGSCPNTQHPSQARSASPKSTNGASLRTNETFIHTPF